MKFKSDCKREARSEDIGGRREKTERLFLFRKAAVSS